MSDIQAGAAAAPVSPEAFRGEVPGYYINAINDFLARCGPLTGLRVLEIGGSSLPRALVLDTLGAVQWVCVDILNHASGSYQVAAQREHYEQVGVRALQHDSVIPPQPYVIFDGSADRIPEAFDGQFDVVFSINSFEHVMPLDEVLARAHAALRPGGVLFSQFGPIWSCLVGSHFWVTDSFNFNAPEPLPSWAHLLMSREQIGGHLRAAGLADDTVNQALYQIFESSFVNRRFYEEYEEALARSGFAPTFEIEPLWAREVPPATQALLEARHPGRREFGAYGIRLVARREAARRPGLLVQAGSPSEAAQWPRLLGNDGTPGLDAVAANEALLQQAAAAHLGPDLAAHVVQGLAAGQLWLARWPEAMSMTGSPLPALPAPPPGACVADPLLALTQAAWRSADAGAVLLFPVRAPAQAAALILHECRTDRALLQHRISVADALALWRQAALHVLRALREGASVLVVCEETLADPAQRAALESRLSRRWNGMPPLPAGADGSELQVDAANAALHGLLRALCSAAFGTDREQALRLIDGWAAGAATPATS